MDEKLGQAAYETERGTFLGQPIEGGGRRFSQDTAREIDIAVRDRIQEVYQRTLDVLGARRDEMETLAVKLLEQETLTEDELPKPVAPPEPRVA
jgi:cell division protease FtsH